MIGAYDCVYVYTMTMGAAQAAERRKNEIFY